ncbi:uncharacterized protein [Diabrotica undecimpunctata]|uniref:uncharacterized protein n=1 Tax=Diabrotica undecimpunctata TaxID=50387 RepID=UPI003B63D981
MESWFDAIEQTNVTTEYDIIQAFADDQIILLTGKSLGQIEHKWAQIWTVCEKWAESYKLSYNSSKTEALFIPHKPTRAPRVRIKDDLITPSANLKYLGLTIDTGLQWLDHVKLNRQKAADIGHKLFIIAGKDWGRKAQTLKAIYEGAIKPMLLYGAEIWGKRATDSRIAKQLAAAERPFLRAITRAYNTAPTSALHVLAGTTPLSVDALAAHLTYTEHKNTIDTHKIRTIETQHPTARIIQKLHDTTPDIRAFADASVKNIEDNTSKTIGTNIESTQTNVRTNYIIDTTGNINDLETMALHINTENITQNILEYQNKTITFYTDSQIVLQQLQDGNNRNKTIIKIKKNLEILTKHNILYTVAKTNKNEPGHKIAHNLANQAHLNPQNTRSVTTRQDIKQIKLNTKLNKWQPYWNNATTGRKTYNIIQQVKLTEPKFNWKTTQLLTGHGHTQEYYNRFNLRNTNGNCTHYNTLEDQQHIINDCTLPQRITARQTLTNKLTQVHMTYPPTNIDTTNKEIVEWINDWGEQMILDDEEDDQ